MSRTYKRFIRCFHCSGDNREFYNLRRRQIRHRVNLSIRTLFANYEPDSFEERWKGVDKILKERWAEPTDGHRLLFKDRLKADDRFYGYQYGIHKKYDRYLKKKH